MNKNDLKGTERSIFVCNGATGHSRTGDRAEHDFYASSPEAAQWLMKIEPQINNIYESAVGCGHLAEEFRKAGKLGAISDLVDRGYHPEGIPAKYPLDFLSFNKIWKGDMVTNPPYIKHQSWVEHSLNCLTEGHYLALFLKITFAEGKERRDLFKKYPPIRVWVSSSRIACAKNGEFTTTKENSKGELVESKISSAACYCWYIWQKGYKGPTELKWFN